MDDSFWIPNFRHLQWTASAVDTKHGVLYLDGGEIWNGTLTSNKTHYVIMGSTISIDLSTSWTPQKVPAKVVADKNEHFPYAQGEVLWYNTERDRLQVLSGPNNNDYGGWVWSVAKQDVIFDAPGYLSQKVFELDLRYGNWVPSDTQPSQVGISGAERAALTVATPDSFYGLGGVIAQNMNYVCQAQPGLVDYDFNQDVWSNSTSTAFGKSGFAAFGEAVYTPVFGNKGVLIFFAGYDPSSYSFTPQTTRGLADLSNITVYDIDTGTYLAQTAVGAGDGTLPTPRLMSCSVSVSQPSSGTLDIFLYGGQDNGLVGEAPDPNTSCVWVLSLPSFVWTKIPDSHAQMLALHTCEVIGNRQMVVVGGANPTSQFGGNIDPWPNGIGIFDMSAWKWTNTYDANAAQYSRAQQLVAQSSAQPYATSWDSDAVRRIFDPANKSNPPPGGVGSGGSNDGSSGGPSIGLIVGVTILGIVFLCLILSAFFIMRRQKKKKRARMSRSELPPEETKRDTWGSPRPDGPKQTENVNVTQTEIGPVDVGRQEMNSMGSPYPQEEKHTYSMTEARVEIGEEDARIYEMDAWAAQHRVELEDTGPYRYGGREAYELG